ncbi:MAG TPA: carboxypeptidase regulatory-like domain-containing protein [Luteimonas sp.]|nr:carboxypeptidase regulatory-like domain-containing protein [Luteimonas sp.]
MNSKTLRKTVLFMALGVCLSTLVPAQYAYAANTDGSLVGQTVAGAEVTVRNPETNFTRTITADADGNYRFPFLPVGNYTLQASKSGTPVGQPIQVTVSLGNATTVNLGSADMTTLGAIQVVGSRVVTLVDVTSTESATNITKAELDRLPVGRSADAVAQLAPGVIGGSFGGISFGGSSVAENTVYINGLNVTDFYKRVGFSSIPFSFFKEFQIKTGGYSVEFGRTTGGVINAVTKSGTNEFHYGTEFVWRPDSLQTRADNQPLIVSRYDKVDDRSLNGYASGPIIRDKLFFYTMYEARDYNTVNTSNDGENYFDAHSDSPFWGAKLDWQVADGHLLELLAFSDKNEVAMDDYNFDPIAGKRAGFNNTRFTESGGTNWALTYTGYLTDDLSMKLLYGGNKRVRVQNSLNDINCSRVRDRRPGGGDVGCTTSGLIEKGLDDRQAARADFEWSLGDHLLRFGLDREVNTSDNVSFYPGPDRLLYEIRNTTAGATLENGGTVPAGVTAYVRTRQQEVTGTFETLNTAYYLEDNWSVTPNLVFDAGLRVEGFDNKNGEGNTYIKMENLLAPRFGFAWDVNADGRSKIFGNVGRYFLPVSNIINVKQAGAFLDERTYYAFGGFEPFEYNGQTYQRPILGPQIGAVDNSQGDGTVGDLRGEVDADMDPVYQDELILGYQSLITDKWSWGVRGIYRKLHNAIDDMEITSNGIVCGGSPGYVGFVMANPGEDVTVYTDTNCDGVNDGFVTIDTSKKGWALYDDNGNYVGELGWVKPRRTYKALEFVIDRAWDEKWALNASYTLSYSDGNAEGPVNTDTGFDNTGRTEHFDDPFVNRASYGPLPNDRRHQVKLRGSYAFNEHWLAGATLNAQSGRPVTGFGVGNPFDGTNYTSNYICIANCLSDIPSERVYQISPRGGYGTLPWTFDVGASLTYQRAIGPSHLRVTLSAFNLLNQQRVTDVDQTLEDDIGHSNSQANGGTFLLGTGYQSPRYAQFTVALDF